MTTYVYDAGVLVAADRNDPITWSRHRARIEVGATLLVPAPVVAQVSRSSKQAQLRRFLRGCQVVPFGEADAHEAGLLLARAKRSDVVDASVVALAMRTRALILTGDRADIQRLVSASGGDVSVVEV